MKRFFKITFFIIIALAVCSIVFVKIYEKRLIEAFKKEIIDNTDLNIDFGDIHFSLLKYFPNGSFILEDAHVFYSKPSRNDTLVSAKKLCFKVNALNLFSNVYEFPEVIIYEGLVNIDIDKINQFIPSNSNEKESNYIIKAKSIEFVRCNLNYFQKKDIALRLFVDNSKCSGSFLSNAISLNINFKINRLYIEAYGYKYRSNKLITLSAAVSEKNKTFFAENCELGISSMDFLVSFLYNQQTELLQITASSNKLNVRKFFKDFFPAFEINFEKGLLSLNASYSVITKRRGSQKLSLKYRLANSELVNTNGRLSIKNLEGSTSFGNNFESNSSEINKFDISYRGINIKGKSRIRNLISPTIIIESTVKSDGEVEFSKDLSIRGKVDGILKALVKIEDIKNFNINGLKVKRISSELSLVDVSIKDINYLDKLSGRIQIEDNQFNFSGEGEFYHEKFTGTCDFNNFIEVSTRGAKVTPNFNIEMESLNLDAVLSENSESQSSSKFFLSSKIAKVKFLGAYFNSLRFNIKGENGRYTCNNFSFNAFSGSLAGNFVFSGNDSSSFNIVGQGVNISSLFNEFNNFGQSFIRYNNIFGSVSGKVSMRYKMGSNGKIDIQSIKSKSNLIVENGRLTGLSQLKRVSKFLNLNEMDSIRFKTLQNEIDIENGLIKIPSMEIYSNALNFKIAGEHNFNNEYTYWMKISLKEILAKKFKSNKNNDPNIELDDHNGLNLYLKLYGNIDSYKIVYDRKKSLEHLKTNLNQEGQLLKTILKEEFNLSKSNAKDSSLIKKQNLLDTSHNKTGKKPFRIEWDEIDTSKVNNL